MGHDAFVDGYKKPNFKLHLIIFVTIVGVSVFLSTQVEKSKSNTRVEALKIPVPIDSVFVDSDTTRAVAKVKSSSKTAPSKPVNKPETEYRFDDGSSLTKIDKMLAKHDQTSESAETGKLAEIPAEKQNVLEDEVKISTKKEPAREKDIAIMVTEEVVNESAPTKSKFNAIGTMDTVYELQQDRFLETLAKSAVLESKESIDIKRIKEAIRADRPLNIKSASTAKPEKKSQLVAEQTGIVKVASTKVTGVIKPVSKISDKKTSSIKVTKNTNTIALASETKVSKSLKVDQMALTKSELNNVLSQFMRSYNKGDINRLIALFDENARTNDQKNKQGIKAEYAELFKTTVDRNIKIKNVQWNLGKGKAKGDAKFVVTVKPLGSTTSALFEGNIQITAIKGSRGVFIKSMLHKVNER